jgi:peptidoglycan hydrolase-like protein with peptidoglycan-binding domain
VATPLNIGQYELELAAARKKEKRKAGVVGRGSTNRAAVRATQERLSELGFEVSTDGIFGPETEKALREFQRSRNAKPDGLVGPETLGKLLRAKRAKANPADTGLDAIERVVGVGRPRTSTAGKGLGDIRARQRGGGTGGETEGRRERRKASRERRRSGGAAEKGPNGGSVDAEGNEIASKKTGSIGSTEVPEPKAFTWDQGKKGGHEPDQKQPPSNPDFEALHPREGGKFIKKGSTGEDVQNTQTALNKVGGAKLQEDGQFGDQTDAAVRAYQKAKGLTVDGIVGPKTSASLRRRLKLVKNINKERAA